MSELDSVQPGEKSIGAIRERLSIQFIGNLQERDTNFGEFCVELTTRNVQFTIVGDRTIVMYKDTVDGLYGRPRDLYKKHLENQMIEIGAVQVTGERLRKPRDTAKERARWYMQNR